MLSVTVLLRSLKKRENETKRLKTGKKNSPRKLVIIEEISHLISGKF